MAEGFKMKYVVSKADGSPIDPEACYFVLRLDTDHAARAAMWTYAGVVGNVELSEDIAVCLNELAGRRDCNCREAHCEHEVIFSESRVWRHGGAAAAEEGD